MLKFNIGSDPEFFLLDTKTNSIISSIGIIPGEKGNAYKPKDLPKGYGLEIDNILGEFNIPPCDSKEEFVEAMITMKNWTKEFMKKQNPDLEMLHIASAIIDESQLQSDEAKLFGCSIDYNAYTDEPNPKPEAQNQALRSCGLHIHVGIEKPLSKQEACELVKLMDKYLGVASIYMDGDTRRRELYGKAGAFRYTPYGIEYRTLSGFFLRDEYLGWLYDGTAMAVKDFSEGKFLTDEENIEIPYIINSGDVESALEYTYSKCMNK